MFSFEFFTSIFERLLGGNLCDLNNTRAFYSRDFASDMSFGTSFGSSSRSFVF